MTEGESIIKIHCSNLKDKASRRNKL